MNQEYLLSIANYAAHYAREFTTDCKLVIIHFDDPHVIKPILDKTNSAVKFHMDRAILRTAEIVNIITKH